MDTPILSLQRTAKVITFLLTIQSLSFCQNTVACIGNSITDFSTYPDTLQKLLGAGWQVQNDGVSGTTMLKNGDFTYWREGKWSQLFQFRPDVVTIKLGTNDAKHDPIGVDNWQYKNQYIPDYHSMIDTIYNTLGYTPRIFCVFPVPMYQNSMNVVDATLTEEMIPMIKQVAAERGLATIDCHTPLMNRPNLFPDGIHPNDAGTDSIAYIMHRTMTTTAMLAYPASLNFTAIPGQTATVTPKTLTISNIAVIDTLDAVQTVNKQLWLQCSVNASARNAQVITNTIVPTSLPQSEGIFYDTVTVTAPNANPTTLAYVITLVMHEEPVQTKLVILPDSVIVAPTEKDTFTAVVYDQYNDPISPQPAVTWSATGSTISSAGIFTAPSSPGSYRIIATSGMLKDTTVAFVSNSFTLLSPGRIKRLLVLQRSNSLYIPRGTGDLQTDFTGRDSTMRPAQDSTATINGNSCVWNIATSGNGNWASDQAQNNFVAYSALYLYTPRTRIVYCAYNYDEKCMIRQNGTAVVSDTDPMISGTPDKLSPPCELQKGLTLFTFKLMEFSGANHIRVRFTDSLGTDLDDLYVQFSPEVIDLPTVSDDSPRTISITPTAPLIRRLHNGMIMVTIHKAGKHTISLVTPNGKTVISETVSTAGEYLIQTHRTGAGLYFIFVTSAGNQNFYKKMVLL